MTLIEFIQQLSELNKKLLDEYVNVNYNSKVRTGKGKMKNFLAQHDSPEGIKIVKELLKFKRLEKSSIKNKK